MKLILYTVGALIGLAGFVFLTTGGGTFGVASAENISWMKIAVGYFVTVLGVFLGTAYRELQKRREAGELRIDQPRQFIHDLGRSVDLWLGLIGSPIVYALIWQSIGGQNITMPAIIVIALQNGFACTIVLASFTPKPLEPAQP